MNQLKDYVIERKERASELPGGDLPVYGVDRKDGLTPAAKYQSKNLSRYKVIRPGMFAYNPMRLNIGSIAYCKDSQLIGLVSPDYVVFSCNENFLDHNFMKYAILAPEWHHWTHSAGVGSVRIRIYFKELATMPFTPLPLPEQKAIAHVLGTLDDRIELNRRMNETLEAIAQALFKSWFVNFDPVIDNALAGGKEIPAELSEKAQARAALGDKRRPLPEEIRTLFPDEFIYSNELGWIPMGWEVGKIEDHALIDMGQSPKGDTYNTEGNGVPLVNGPVEFGEYFTEKSKWTTAPTKLSEPGDLIVCVRGSTTGRFVKSDGKYCLGRGVCSFRAKRSQCFVDQLYKNNFKQMLALTTGSTFPNWSKQTLTEFPAIFFQPPVAEEFDKFISPLVFRQEKTINQSRTFENLRDTLLPKLLSGELRIPDAEKMVEELAL